MKPIFWAYLGVAFIGLAFFIYNVLKFRARKKLAGDVSCTWSSTLNLGIPANRMRWLILMLFIPLIVYFFLTEPGARGNYHLVLFYILVLSFYPRWNILVGSKGVLVGMNFIPWEKMIEKKVIEGKKITRLEFSYASGSDPSKTMAKRIQIPLKKCKNIMAFLKSNY